MPELKERPVTRSQLESQAGRFIMPLAEVGQIVTYYHDCNYAAPMPAIVLHVDERSIALSAFVKDSPALLAMPHVRHRQDPALSNPDVQADGAWEHPRRDNEFSGLVNDHESSINVLSTEIDSLKAVVQKLVAGQPAVATKAK